MPSFTDVSSILHHCNDIHYHDNYYRSIQVHVYKHSHIDSQSIQILKFSFGGHAPASLVLACFAC